MSEATVLGAGEARRIANDIGSVLAARGVALDGDIVGVVPFGSGHSGFTFTVATTTGARYVLRLSPPGTRIAGPADVGRQGRIMGALGRAGIPVPAILAWASEPVIDGRAFVLMELVTATDYAPVAARHGDRYVAERALDVLHALARVDPQRAGIDDEPATPAAEVQRWAGLMRRAPEHLERPGSDLRAVLEADPPGPSPPVVVHGDYHYGNLLFCADHVAAVVDWEIAELGPALVDLGSLAVVALRGRYAPEPNPTGSLDVTIAELVALHGADPDEAAWYVALACFKYAAIFAYNLGLHRSGRRHDPIYEALQGTMSGLLADGMTIARHGIAAIGRTGRESG